MDVVALYSNILIFWMMRDCLLSDKRLGGRDEKMYLVTVELPELLMARF